LRPISAPILTPLVLALAVAAVAATAAAQEAEPPTLEGAAALAAAGDWAAAAGVYQELTISEPENGEVWFGLGLSRYRLGHHGLAVAAYRQAFELGYQPPTTAFHLARAYAAAGDETAAVEWLDRLAQSGARIHQLIASTPEFERLRGNKAFDEIVARTTPCSAPPYHKLDFWVGDWIVVTGEGEREVGRNSIVKILNGCAVIENWVGGTGSEGKSLFYYHEGEKIWKQVWITDFQSLKEKRMIAELAGGAVRFQGELPQGDGSRVLDRTTLIPLPEGRVRQVIEQSRDGGETWQVGFDAIYVPQTPPPDP
jgi:tetratricopeptide (TPR) repeat protein